MGTLLVSLHSSQLCTGAGRCNKYIIGWREEMVASGCCSRARDIQSTGGGRNVRCKGAAGRGGKAGDGSFISIMIQRYTITSSWGRTRVYGNTATAISTQQPPPLHPSTPPSPTYRQGCSGDTQSPELSHSQIRATVSQKAQTANSGARKCCTVRSWRLAARRR